MSNRNEVVRSSGNVFKDLGYDQSEEVLAKAELIRRISHIIEKRQLTQAQAAKLLGIEQPKISALLNGKVSGFSTERLFRFLNELGQNIEIVVKAKRPAERRAHIHVLIPA